MAEFVLDHGQEVCSLGNGRVRVVLPGAELDVIEGRLVDKPAVTRGVQVDHDPRRRSDRQHRAVEVANRNGDGLQLPDLGRTLDPPGPNLRSPRRGSTSRSVEVNAFAVLVAIGAVANWSGDAWLWSKPRRSGVAVVRNRKTIVAVVDFVGCR